MGVKNSINRPAILHEGEYKIEDLILFKKRISIWNIVDLYVSQLKELFEITNPHLIYSENFNTAQDKFVKKIIGSNPEIKGNWVYFPWNGNFVHMINATDYLNLRTNRNKLLINDTEQQKLRNSTVAFLGLSIGGNMAVSLAYSGIAKNMKLAEYDSLSTSNLNRLRATIYEVGLPKIQITANKIFEIDPYANLIGFNQGITLKNLDIFFDKDPRPQLIYEACDDFKMKVKIRLEAKKRRIPLVMLTSLGDSLLVDVERYDINPNLEIFNGRVGLITEEILAKEITEENKKKFAIMLVGKENVPERAIETIKGIGKKFVGRPQINSTVTVGSGIAAFLAKEILLNNSQFSGRSKLLFSDII